MRKTLIVTLAFFLLFAGGVVSVMSSLLSAREAVTITEENEYGDKSAADGLTVRVNKTYDKYLFWDSEVRFGQVPTFSADYSFHATQVSGTPKTPTYGLVISNGIRGDITDFTGEEHAGMSAAMKAHFDALSPGEYENITGNMSDYFFYHPFGIQITLPDRTLNSTDYAYSSVSENDKTVITDIENFLRIPVAPDETGHFCLNKSENGSDCTLTVSGSFDCSSYSTATDRAVYFVISAYSQSAYGVDTSLIPGGFGIYCLPYEGENIKSGKLHTVYELDSKTEIVNLTKSADNSKLLLFTNENGKKYLTVINIADMREVQRIAMGDSREVWGNFYSGDGFTVIYTYSRITVLEQDGNGNYAVAMVADFPQNIGLPEFFLRNPQSMDYRNGKLAIGAVSYYDFRNDAVLTCGFEVAVFDASGLLYYAAYQSNLTPFSDSKHTPYGFSPVYGTFPVVKWQETGS